MLLAAGLLCAKGKIVFRGAPEAEWPKIEGYPVGTTQNIQDEDKTGII